MTRTERKTLSSKNTHKLIKRALIKVLLTAIIFLLGIMCSVITDDASALFLIVFIVIPLIFTRRNIYIK